MLASDRKPDGELSMLPDEQIHPQRVSTQTQHWHSPAFAVLSVRWAGFDVSNEVFSDTGQAACKHEVQRTSVAQEHVRGSHRA